MHLVFIFIKMSVDGSSVSKRLTNSLSNNCYLKIEVKIRTMFLVESVCNLLIHLRLHVKYSRLVYFRKR